MCLSSARYITNIPGFFHLFFVWQFGDKILNITHKKMYSPACPKRKTLEK